MGKRGNKKLKQKASKKSVTASSTAIDNIKIEWKCPCEKADTSPIVLQCKFTNCAVSWWHAPCAGLASLSKEEAAKLLQEWTCPMCIVKNAPWNKNTQAQVALLENENENKQLTEEELSYEAAMQNLSEIDSRLQEDCWEDQCFPDEEESFDYEAYEDRYQEELELEEEDRQQQMLEIERQYELYEENVRGMISRPDKPKICKQFRLGTCAHGISGKTVVHGQTCSQPHPEVCKRFVDYGMCEKGCTRGKYCNKFHPWICAESFKLKQCSARECKKWHLKGTVKLPCKKKWGQSWKERYKDSKRKSRAKNQCCSTPAMPASVADQGSQTQCVRLII